MNKEQQPIPEEIIWKAWEYDNRTYGGNGINPVPYRFGFKAGYNHLAPEIAALKAERDAYREALEEIINKYSFGQAAAIAINALEQYASPSKD